jgi:CheY-like chemotaxis protein
LLVVINDILDFSRIEAHKLELEQVSFDLADLLDRWSAVFRLRAREKGLALATVIDVGVPRALRGDPGRLSQILNNLAGNAIKFTARGSVTVRVSVERTSADAAVLRFSVRDTGIGVRADQADRLFEKFTQVDASTARQFGGSGLGLAIAKQLARLMGGEIGVVSPVVDETFGDTPGAEFWFTAAFAVETVSAPAPGVAASAQPARPELRRFANRPGRVLVAEDNVTNQLVALGILRKLGVEADAVADGTEAIRALATADYAMVFMDVQMPVLDGYDATRQIRNPQSAVRRHDVPIVAMTAHAMVGDRERCLDAGMNDYISKPVSPLAIADVLDRWLPPAPADTPR